MEGGAPAGALLVSLEAAAGGGIGALGAAAGPVPAGAGVAGHELLRGLSRRPSPNSSSTWDAQSVRGSWSAGAEMRLSSWVGVDDRGGEGDI